MADLDQSQIQSLAAPFDPQYYDDIRGRLREPFLRNVGNQFDREKVKQAKRNALIVADEIAVKLGFQRPIHVPGFH